MQNFQNSKIFHWFDRSNLILDWSKMSKFQVKTLWFDWCLIDAWLIEISQKSLLIDARFLTTDRNSKFSNFKVLTDQTLVCTILSFFFSSSWLLLELKKQKKTKKQKKNYPFWVKVSRVFFCTSTKTFLPFLFYRITSFHA